MLYRPIPRSEILDALIHIRGLHRRAKPSGESERSTYDRREAVIRDLVSNLPRANEHPTLKTLLDVANSCQRTIEGAHRLFGYNLNEIRAYDLRLNGGRTHIVESYPFQRDLLVDLPSQLAPREAFGFDADLQDLVPAWQKAIPIRLVDTIS